MTACLGSSRSCSCPRTFPTATGSVTTRPSIPKTLMRKTPPSSSAQADSLRWKLGASISTWPISHRAFGLGTISRSNLCRLTLPPLRCTVKQVAATHIAATARKATSQQAIVRPICGRQGDAGLQQAYDALHHHIAPKKKSPPERVATAMFRQTRRLLRKGTGPGHGRDLRAASQGLR